MKRQAVQPAAGDQVRIEVSSIPAHAATNIAQVVFEAVHRAFEDPAIRADYEEWKKKRGARQHG